MIIGEIDTVVLIGKEGCAACTAAKQRLELNKTPYVYIDIDELPPVTAKAIVACRKKAGIKKISVPLVIQNKQLMMGFEDERTEA